MSKELRRQFLEASESFAVSWQRLVTLQDQACALPETEQFTLVAPLIDLITEQQTTFLQMLLIQFDYIVSLSAGSPREVGRGLHLVTDGDPNP